MNAACQFNKVKLSSLCVAQKIKPTIQNLYKLN